MSEYISKQIETQYEDFANFSFSAQLWKFNKKKQTLENKNGQWKFENKTWSKSVFKGKLNLLLHYIIYSYFSQNMDQKINCLLHTCFVFILTFYEKRMVKGYEDMS